MSSLLTILPGVDIERAITEAESLGVRVVWCNHLDGLHAAYQHQARRIILSTHLPEYAILPNLLHELEHARAGHDGRQPRRIEERVNETVARQLITLEAYARAEELTGGHAGAIALELDLPTWVVVAYQRILAREPCSLIA